jgi:hypothetical protein
MIRCRHKVSDIVVCGEHMCWACWEKYCNPEQDVNKTQKIIDEYD